MLYFSRKNSCEMIIIAGNILLTQGGWQAVPQQYACLGLFNFL